MTDTTNTTMTRSRLGASGPEVSRLGLGAMSMSGSYGASEDEVSIATVHAALDSGVNLIDTGDFYGMGHNEMLLRQALRGVPRDNVVLSVKFGALRGPRAGEFGGVDTRPVAVRNWLAYTLQRLGVEYVDVYRPARLDPAVPIEDTVGAIAELIDEGYVRHIGLSEVGAETIRRAAAVAPISDLQIEYSLISRGIESTILPTCRELGIGVTAYGVLSRGLLSDSLRAAPGFADTDFRAHSPRFQGENLRRNLTLVEALARVAERHGATVAQLAIAWVLSRGEDIVPLIGARRPERWAESARALAFELSPADLDEIESAVPLDAVAGERYPTAQMASLDSER